MEGVREEMTERRGTYTEADLLAAIAERDKTIERLTAQLIWWRKEYPTDEAMRKLAEGE